MILPNAIYQYTTLTLRLSEQTQTPVSIIHYCIQYFIYNRFYSNQLSDSPKSPSMHMRRHIEPQSRCGPHVWTQLRKSSHVVTCVAILLKTLAYVRDILTTP